jgi:hypothetical protein
MKVIMVMCCILLSRHYFCTQNALDTSIFIYILRRNLVFYAMPLCSFITEYRWLESIAIRCTEQSTPISKNIAFVYQINFDVILLHNYICC